jgi:hypothetical protein
MAEHCALRDRQPTKLKPRKRSAEMAASAVAGVRLASSVDALYTFTHRCHRLVANSLNVNGNAI